MNKRQSIERPLLAFFREVDHSFRDLSDIAEARMVDFARQRQAMVDSQVRVNDVTDLRIIDAMLELPREQFVPKNRVELSYIDEDLPLTSAKGTTPARFMTEPMVLAKLVQALELAPDNRALVIGCATGYSAALLGKLVQEVVALEEDTELAAAAKRTLSALGASNVSVVTGPLHAGWAQGEPYDAILIDGSVEFVPEPITAQLKDGARLVTVVGTGRSAKALVHVRSGGVISARPIFDAAIPPLPGFAHPPQFVF